MVATDPGAPLCWRAFRIVATGSGNLIMNVLVFGAGGQVGSALLRTAWPTGTKIVGRTHAETDVGDAAAVAAAFDSGSWDVAINAAGHTAVDKAESEPAAALRINGEAPGLLAWECAKRGTALFHI